MPVGGQKRLESSGAKRAGTTTFSPSNSVLKRARTNLQPQAAPVLIETGKTSFVPENQNGRKAAVPVARGVQPNRAITGQDGLAALSIKGTGGFRRRHGRARCSEPLPKSSFRRSQERNAPGRPRSLTGGSVHGPCGAIACTPARRSEPQSRYRHASNSSSREMCFSR